MEIYVPEAVAQDITISKSFHVDAQIGRVEAANTKKLTISSKYGLLNINIIRSIPLSTISLCS
jgi:hypothetical protein